MSQFVMSLSGVRPPAPVGERRSQDDYYTPAALVAALLDHLEGKHDTCQQLLFKDHRVVDPHAGSGVWLEAFERRGYGFQGSDIAAEAEALSRWPAETFQHDFLKPWPAERPDWILGNPNYKGAMGQILQSLKVATVGVGFVLRLGFLATHDRFKHLFSLFPPAHIFILAERPSFTGGATDKYENCFIVWRVGSQQRVQGTMTHWVSWR